MIFPLTAHQKNKQKKPKQTPRCVSTDTSAQSKAQNRNILGWCLLSVTDIRAKGSLQAKYWQAVLLQGVAASCCV